jgi:hypothetical protein
MIIHDSEGPEIIAISYENFYLGSFINQKKFYILREFNFEMVIQINPVNIKGEICEPKRA